MLACFLVLVLASPAELPAADLVGEWTLVSQHYGEGTNNLMRSAPEAVRLSFTREGSTIRGKIFAGDRFPEGLPWPAFVNDEGPLPVEVTALGASEREAHAEYRVRPSPADDLLLRIEERYSIAADGETLTGTMTVSFVRGGEPRGSFILHRRYERAGR